MMQFRVFNMMRSTDRSSLATKIPKPIYAVSQVLHQLCCCCCDRRPGIFPEMVGLKPPATSKRRAVKAILTICLIHTISSYTLTSTVPLATLSWPYVCSWSCYALFRSTRSPSTTFPNSLWLIDWQEPSFFTGRNLEGAMVEFPRRLMVKLNWKPWSPNLSFGSNYTTLYYVWVATSFVAGIVRTQKAANCISRCHGLGELITILPLNVFAMFPRKKSWGCQVSKD